MLLGFFCTLENTTFLPGWFRSPHSSNFVCVDVFTLKLYYLHSQFLSFRTCYPSLDVLLLFSASFLMNQVEELNCKFRTIPNLAGATQEAPHQVQRPMTKACFLSQGQYNSSAFSLQKEVVLKIQFQGC